MNCVKCGREIPETQVFCDSCLSMMDKYPVKPGTLVHLPHRSKGEPAKKPSRKRKELSGDELCEYLFKTVRRQRYALVLLMALVLLLSGILLYSQQKTDTPLPGRNYTVDSTQTP